MLTEINTSTAGQPSKPMMTMYEAHGIFVDALLADQANNLVFVSLWGRDTSVREMQSRITLGSAEGGLTVFNVIEKLPETQALIEGRSQRKHFVRIGDANALEQHTGRVQTDILGELVHWFLFQRTILKPDLANHRATLIGHDLRFAKDDRLIWSLIRSICPVPLLDHWAADLMPVFRGSGMIDTFSGINQVGVQIALDEERVANYVKQACQEGRLSLGTLS
jgi:hypothetical protein